MKTLLIFVSFLISFYNLQGQQAKNKTAVHVGDNYQGGVVFHVDSAGQHGLIAAKTDQTTDKIKWGKHGHTYAISKNDGFFNTNKILDFHNFTVGCKGKAAAYLCDSLVIDGYSDWYLPSIDELKMMYDEQNIIGSFKKGDYCSSTEYGYNDAYSIHFRKYSSIIYFYNKPAKDYYVRCVRKF